MNPTIIKVVAGAAAVISLLWVGYHFGAQSVQAGWNAERAAQAEATGATNRAVLRGFETAAESSRKEKEDAKIENDKLRIAVATGARRLSVPVTSCKQADDSRVGDKQARADIVPEVAQRIIDVGIDGDDTVLDLNACIDKYNAIRDRLSRLDE